jgi:DNA-directed RNA polymerase specialized sigma24 family protein
MTDQPTATHLRPSRDRVQPWRAALDRLTARDRLILCLRDDQRLPSARIAVMLGLPIAAVDRRYTRAVQILPVQGRDPAPHALRPAPHPRCLTPGRTRRRP